MSHVPLEVPALTRESGGADDARVRERIAHLDRLLGELELLPTNPARARAMETIEALIGSTESGWPG